MKHHGVSERWRQQLGALRAALDQHISAIEAALDESDRDLLAETQQMKTAMAEAQTHLVELTAELAKTRQRLSDVSSAKASLQAQYQQLASQRMTDALSQMLQGREDAAPSKAAPPPSTPAAGPTLTSVPAISAPKKPLQFSERGARRQTRQNSPRHPREC
jgi:chromosome segregation ATPase